MPIRVTEIRISLEGDDGSAIDRAMKRARLAPEEVASVELVRKSMDKRRRQPELVFTLDFHLVDPRRGASTAARKNDPRVRWVETATPETLEPGEAPLEHRPVVIGAGPAGLFAGLILAREGYRPLIIERGSRMNRRVGQIAAFHRSWTLDPESNYLFGEGGAGTFSDGKLTSRSRDPRAQLVLDEFRRKSGLELVGYYYRPHLGSDRVRAVVAKLRREIESHGGEFRYDCRVDGLDVRGRKLVGLATSSGPVAAEAVIAAPGHSARDFYAALALAGVPMEAKPFQMGFRIEHPQDFVDRCVYGRSREELGLNPADYRLVAQVEGRGVFSFCMCPGGEIIPAVSDRDHYNTNGMSYFSKDTGFANSGMVTTIEPHEFEDPSIFGGLELQKKYEARAAQIAGAEFLLPAQRLTDFFHGRPSADLPATSCRTGKIATDVANLAPSWLSQALRGALERFDRQMPGYLAEDALICGPEARSSAPVRILRDLESMESPDLSGLFPVGEGAGFAGGIVSAAVDGWRAAEALVRKHARPAGS